MENDLALLALDMKQALEGKPKFKQARAEKRMIAPLNVMTKYLKNELSDKKIKLPYKLEDWPKLKEKASAGISLEKLAQNDANDEVKDSLLVAGIEFNDKLLNIIPINSSQTLLGIDERDPSDFEKSKFIRKMRVIENPEHIIDLLKKGQLSWTEMDTLRDFYPTYSELLLQGSLEALASLKGNTKEPLSKEQTRALSLILDVQKVTPEILERVEEENQKEKAEINDPASQEGDMTRLAGG